jgi:hypothetical protein
MDKGLHLSVALDGIYVVEIEIYERRRRQQNRQFQREHEPEPIVAAPELFSLRRHFNLRKALRDMEESIPRRISSGVKDR